MFITAERNVVPDRRIGQGEISSGSRQGGEGREMDRIEPAVFARIAAVS